MSQLPLSLSPQPALDFHNIVAVYHYGTIWCERGGGSYVRGREISIFTAC